VAVDEPGERDFSPAVVHVAAGEPLTDLDDTTVAEENVDTVFDTARRVLSEDRVDVL